MRAIISAVLALLFSGSLAGCALPPAVSVASLLLDGISYISTEKSVNDHVLSEVTRSDCAVWRVVKDELVCRDYADGEQGLLATMADALDSDLSGAGATPVAEARPAVQPVGQISAAEPAGVVAEAPGL
jgi:hypothetical protein